MRPPVAKVKAKKALECNHQDYQRSYRQGVFENHRFQPGELGCKNNWLSWVHQEGFFQVCCEFEEISRHCKWCQDVVNSDCHGLAKPTGSRVGSARVRVRIGYFQPSPYPDHHHGLAVTREKTRSDTIKYNINITKNFSLLIY